MVVTWAFGAKWLVWVVWLAMLGTYKRYPENTSDGEINASDPLWIWSVNLFIRDIFYGYIELLLTLLRGVFLFSLFPIILQEILLSYVVIYYSLIFLRIFLYHQFLMYLQFHNNSCLNSTFDTLSKIKIRLELIQDSKGYVDIIEVCVSWLGHLSNKKKLVAKIVRSNSMKFY